MRRVHLGWPASTLVSLLAALSSWVAMWAWGGFAERPSGFLVPALGGCLLVAVTGMFLRSARVPAFLVTLGQIVVLVVWLNHRWATDLALGGWIPTPDSLREVGATIAQAAKAAQEYASPVPESVPEFYPLLIVTGVAAAVIVDLLACGLRRVPLAGLPLLALFTAPVSILDGGVSWFKFAALALSFVFLLAGDEARRLSRWGRQLSGSTAMFDSQSTEVSTHSVWSSARKIGFTATGLAVIVPILVPTLASSLFNGTGTGLGGKGDSVSISNPMVDLQRDLSRGADIELLRVTTTAPDPSYLRVSVLDAFDGEAWRPSGRNIPVSHRADGLLPRPPGLGIDVPRIEVPYTIAVSDNFESRWLPTPYPLYSINARGDWRYDSSTLDFISAADGQTTANLTYELRGLEIDPTAADLANAGSAPGSIDTPFTALPKGMPISVQELAQQVTDGAASRFEMAVRLQQWFREDGGFAYSLERGPGNGLDQLVKFLGTGPDSRTGYCEQFAAAMAVMGRTLGIPSRVAVGFLRPERVLGDTYVYSSHDLHAWPEMYFEGTGWVRFEPTPQDRASSVPGYTRQQIPSGGPSQAASSAVPVPGRNKFDLPTTSPGTSAARSGGSGSNGPGPLAVFAVLLVVLALLPTPRLTRSLIRRRRWSSATTPVALAEAAWRDLRQTAIDLGLSWDDTVTVRARARDLVTFFGRPGAADDSTTRSPVLGPTANPDATEALDRVVRFLERARYARATYSAGDVTEGVATDVDLCTRALMDGATKQRRLRATWLPASVLGGLAWRSRPRGVRDRRWLAGQPGVDHAV